MSENPVEAEPEGLESILPIRMVSQVVRGFGRGSTDLGIPTANLDRASLKISCANDDDKAAHLPFDDLPTGIYWGFCRIGEKDGDDGIGVVYTAALSMGYNPTYGNTSKTVEAHCIAPASDPRRYASSCGETLLTQDAQDYYKQPIRLSIVGYLRPELPFEGLEKLMVAMKNDIKNAEKLGEQTDNTTLGEHAWVGSDEPV